MPNDSFYDAFRTAHCVHCAAELPIMRGVMKIGNPTMHWSVTNQAAYPCTAPTRDEFERWQGTQIAELREQSESRRDYIQLLDKDVGQQAAEISGYLKFIGQVASSVGVEISGPQDEWVCAIEDAISKQVEQIEGMAAEIADLHVKALPVRRHSDQAWIDRVAHLESELAKAQGDEVADLKDQLGCSRIEANHAQDAVATVRKELSRQAFQLANAHEELQALIFQRDLARAQVEQQAKEIMTAKEARDTALASLAKIEAERMQEALREADRTACSECGEKTDELNAIIQIASKFLSADGSALSTYVEPSYFVQMMVDAASQQSARITALEASNSALREAVAWAYQLAGAVSAGEQALDNLSALSHGDPAPHPWQAAAPIPIAELEAANSDLESRLTAERATGLRLMGQLAEAEMRIAALGDAVLEECATARAQITRVEAQIAKTQRALSISRTGLEDIASASRWSAEAVAARSYLTDIDAVLEEVPLANCKNPDCPVGCPDSHCLLLNDDSDPADYCETDDVAKFLRREDEECQY